MRADDRVSEIAVQVPKAIHVFARLGLDYCTSEPLTLAEACHAADCEPAEVISAIEREAGDPVQDIRWDQRPLSELIDHLLQSFHFVVEHELNAMRSKIQGLARRRAADHLVSDIEQRVDQLAAMVSDHERKEARLLFPIIQEHEKLSAAAGSLHLLIKDHRGIRQEIRIILRQLDDAIARSRSHEGLTDLKAMLSAFDDAFCRHIHLENHVLFPRALMENHARG